MKKATIVILKVVGYITAWGTGIVVGTAFDGLIEKIKAN